MSSNRKLIVELLVIVFSSILVSNCLALAKANEIGKELQAIYAKREKAIKAKKFGYLKLDEADDYTERDKDGTVRNRQQADAEADQIHALVREIHQYSLKIDSIKEGKEPNEIIVETSDEGEFSFAGPDGKVHELSGQGRQRDTWIRTQEGWKVKLHEELESKVKMDGKPIN
jgi:hypothetical protein